MNALSIIGTGVLRLVLGTQQGTVDTVAAVDALRGALDARDYRRAEVLLDAVAAGERALLEARFRFEVGDFVGCTRVAAAALVSAPAAQHQELAWWGAKAALWLQDAAGAEAWTKRLTETTAGDAAWEGVAREYADLADELARGSEEERRALGTSRWTVAVGALLAGTLTLAAACRKSPS